MAFTFTQARELKPEQVNPFANLVSRALQGYGQSMQAAYMPRQLEADIFHKTISPLAMLASSPFFSALNPAQQQQIGSYISQMLSNTPNVAGIAGGPNQLQDRGIPSQSTTGDYGRPEQPYEDVANDNGLVPTTPAEHFTQPFSESGYKGGTVHRDAAGRIIATPTGTQVERSQGILSGASKIGRLYDDYSKLATELADMGEIRRDLSALAGGIGKLPIGGLAKKIEQTLGGSELAEKGAKLEDLEAKIRPALQETGLSNKDIDNILHIRGGESGQALSQRLEDTRNYINNLAKQSKNILGGGFNVSSKQKAISNAMKSKEPNKQIKEAPPGSIGLYRNGELYYIPQNEVDTALKEGFTYE